MLRINAVNDKSGSAKKIELIKLRTHEEEYETQDQIAKRTVRDVPLMARLKRAAKNLSSREGGVKIIAIKAIAVAMAVASIRLDQYSTGKIRGNCAIANPISDEYTDAKTTAAIRSS